MKCYIYWLFEPLEPEFKDEDSSNFSLVANEVIAGREHTAKLFTNQAQRPSFIRIEIQNISKEALPEESLPFLQRTKEHILTLLKLTFDREIKIFQHSVWSFRKNDEGPNMNLKISLDESKTSKLNLKEFSELYRLSEDIQEDLRLLLDGDTDAVPLQYRFLSLYKILERSFKKDGRWDKTLKDASLNKYTKQFIELGYIAKPRNVICDVRDRCAHAATNSNEEGVSHLNNESASEVQNLLPIVTEICRDLIYERSGHKIKLVKFNDHEVRQFP